MQISEILKKDPTIALEESTVRETLLMDQSATDNKTDTKRNSSFVLVVHRLCSHSKVRQLDNIWFGVRRGECFGLYGLPGAGKTRLLETLAGVQPFEEGNFYLWNKRKKTFGYSRHEKVKKCFLIKAKF